MDNKDLSQMNDTQLLMLCVASLMKRASVLGQDNQRYRAMFDEVVFRVENSFQSDLSEPRDA